MLCSLEDLVDGVPRPVDAQTDEIEVAATHRRDRGTVVVVVAGPEQVRGEDRHRQPTTQAALVPRPERLAVALEHQHRLPEHRQVRRAVGVGVRAAHQLRVGRREPADEERGHVEPLAPGQVAAEHGIPPHRYLTGRRVDGARRLLLDGLAPAEVATTVGFHDQAHLTRHFRKVLGVTPAAYAGSHRR